jgi:Ca2+-binding RTX toxin-like protein
MTVTLYERAGSEFVLNAAVGIQSQPKVTWISSSRYVAVWTHDGLDGGVSNPQVWAQIFEADGTAVGSRFMVNGTDGGEQTNAVVAKLAGGGFVIAWEDRYEPSDGSGSSIWYQIYGADGSPVANGPANSSKLNDQSRPSIAGLAGGGFVITWSDASVSGGDSSGLSVKGQLFTAAGVPAGGEFLVNTITTNSQTGSNVVGLPGGGFAVVWEDGSPQGVSQFNLSRPDQGTNIALQIFDASANKVGSERIVDDTIPEVQFTSAQSPGRVTAHNPVAVVLADGTIAVAWDDDWDGYVKTRLLNADGTPAAAVQIVGNATGTQNPAPSIVALADGGYAVSWTAFRAGPPDASGRGVLARVYGEDGSPQGIEFQANSSIAGDQRGSTMLAFDDGSFLVAWHDSTTSDLAGQRFREDSGTISDIALSVPSISKGAIENIQAAILSADGAINAPFTYQLLNDPTGAFRIEGDRLVVADTQLLHGFGGNQATITFRVTDSNGNSFDEAIDIPLTAAPASALFVAGPQSAVTIASSESTAQTPELVALPDGGYFMTWVEAGSNGTYDVKGQFYEANGSRAAPFSINTVTAGNQFESIGVVLADGNVLVTWNGAAQSNSATGTMFDIRAQLLSPTGSKIGGEFVVNTVTAQNQLRGVPTALADGGFLVTWSDGSLADDTSGTGIKAQLFTAAGAKVGTEFLVNTTTAGAQTSPYAAQLHDGTIVIAWSDASATGDDVSGTAIRARFFTSAGAPAGAEFLVNTTTLHSQLTPVVTVLADGRFVIVWGDTSEGTGGTSTADPADIRAQIFDALGNRVGGEILVNTETFGYQGQGSLGAAGVAADSTGGFVVTWTSAAQINSDGDLGAIKAQLFGADGGKVGGEFLVNQIGTNHQGTPAVAYLGDGDLAFAWWDLSSSRTGDNRAIASRRFDSDLSDGPNVIDGTSGPDVILGSPEADLMTGYAGNDTLHGGGEDDSVNGGDGNDTLRGEDGDDSLSGDAGNDTLDGGQGDDRLAGGSGMDSYAGGAGTDTADFSGEPGPVAVNLHSSFFLYPSGPGARSLGPGEALDSFGNYETLSGIENLVLTAAGDLVMASDGANRIEAGAGDDEIMGMGGNDVIIGGDGGDILEGGEGDDTLEGGDGGDELVGEGGNDSINGGLGDDAIFGNAGNDSIDGGGGDDFLFGDAGNDTIEGGDGFDVLHGFDGDDTLSGGGGNDLLRGYAGVDHYDGGADSGPAPDTTGYGDRVSFFDSRATQGVVADLRTGIVSNDGYGNAETMTNIESLGVGTAFIDTFYGNDSINSLLAGAGDNLYGFGGDDLLQLRGAAAVADGGAGTDQLELSTLSDYRPDSNGDGVAELGPDMTSGWTVNLAAGTLRDGFGNVGTVAGVENLLGSALADDLRGNGDSNRIAGGGGNDFLRLQDGGDDNGVGGDGNDVFLFGGTFTSADQVDGGAGTDQIAIQGDYAGAEALTLGSNIVSVENFAILPGNDMRFGDPGTNFYSYEFTLLDGSVAGGVQLVVDANRLRPGENLTFNGSAESDGSFFIYGGGGNDLLTGGAKNDVFIFGHQGQWGTGDVVTGGAGVDQLALRGNYTITFGANQLVGVEQIGMVSAQDTRYGALGSSYSYDLTMVDANVDGIQMTVDAAPLRPGETLTFNGSAEDDGSFRVFGGRGDDTIVGSQNGDILTGNGGADQLTGGGGGDAFRYVAASDSASGSADRILDFTPGTDWIDLSRIDADTHAAGNQAFRWIGSNGFTGTNAASAGELRAYQSGNSWFVEGDTDGNGAADLVIEVTVFGPTPLGADHFLL